MQISNQNAKNIIETKVLKLKIDKKQAKYTKTGKNHKMQSQSGKKYTIKPTKNKGLGIFAIEHISIGTIIEIIPQESAITCDQLRDIYEFDELLFGTPQSRVSVHVLFAYFLAAFEALGNFFGGDWPHIRKYIDELPKDVSGVMMFSPEELEILGGKLFKQSILRKKQKIAINYNKIRSQMIRICSLPHDPFQYRIFQSVEQIQQISLALTLKYYYIIESRSLYFSSNLTQENVGALVPVIDKLNHSAWPNCVVEIGSRYVIRASKMITKGMEIVADYGSFAVLEFLEFYGFVPNSTQEEDQQDEHKCQYQEKPEKHQQIQQSRTIQRTQRKESRTTPPQFQTKKQH